MPYSSDFSQVECINYVSKSKIIKIKFAKLKNLVIILLHNLATISLCLRSKLNFIYMSIKKKIIKILNSIFQQRKGFVIQSIDDSYTFKSTNKFSLIITHLYIVILIVTTSAIIDAFPALFFIDYLFNYIFYALIFLSLTLVYLIIFQLNYYIINIDKHFIDIKIYRTVISTTNPKNHIYIPNETLKEISFLKSSFTFNEILILKIKTDKGEIKIIKLNLLLVSKKEIFRIKKFLRDLIYKLNSSE